MIVKNVNKSMRQYYYYYYYYINTKNLGAWIYLHFINKKLYNNKLLNYDKYILNYYNKINKFMPQDFYYYIQILKILGH